MATTLALPDARLRGDERAEEILALAASSAFPGRVALACSFQKEESVLLDMLFALEPKRTGLRARHPRTSSPRPTPSGARSSGATTRRSRSSRARRSHARPRSTARRCGSASPTCAARSAKVEPLGRALGGLDCLDHRPAPRPVADPRGRAEGRLGRRARALEGEPARRLGRRALLRLHPRARPSLQRAARPRLRLDRLHALHEARRRTRGSLGGHDKTECGLHVPEPATGAVRRERRGAASSSGSPASRRRGSRRSPALVAQDLEPRGVADRPPRRRRRPDAPHEGPRLLQGGPRHEHRAHRLGRLAPRAGRRGRDRLGDLALRRGPPAGARADRGARPASRRGPRRDLARRVRAARPKGLYAMAHAGEIADFTGVSDPYEEPLEPGAVGSSTEGRAPGGVVRRSCSRSSRSSASSVERGASA